MHKVIDELKSDFIFYWVDGIYFKNTPENVSKAMNIFIENGYNSKFYHFDWSSILGRWRSRTRRSVLTFSMLEICDLCIFVSSFLRNLAEMFLATVNIFDVSETVDQSLY